MKKLLLALPIAVLLAAGCNSTQQASNQTPTQSPVAQKTTNPASQNSNIKTYTNDYGYQFTYSSDYILDGSNPNKVTLRIASNNTTDFYGNKPPADITIEYFNDLTSLPHYQSSIKNVDDYLAQSGSAKLMYNITSGKRNGNLLYMFTDAGLKAVYTELIPHNNHYYQTSFSQRETGDQLTVKENQVLTTFKFTK